MKKSLILLTTTLLFMSMNALAVSGILKIHNEWDMEVDYKLSNSLESSGTLDQDDSATIYINKTSDLDRMLFTYELEGTTHTRTLNHACGHVRGAESGLENWLKKHGKAAIYVTFPTRGKMPVFSCRPS